MIISQLIKYLQDKQREIGDAALFSEENDGRSTFAMPVVPTIKYREIWKGHSAGKRYFLDI